MTIEQYYKENPLHWVKHTVDDFRGGRCLMGALEYCYPGAIVANQRYLAALKRLTAVIGGSIVAFNDRDDTTFEDVIRVVRAAKV